MTTTVTGGAVRMRPVTLIGESARGEVFVGIDEVLGRRAVIRKLAWSAFDEGSREALIREARILSRLNHPHVQRIHHYSEVGEHGVFEFEYADGRKLSEALDERLEFSRRVRIAIAVTSALVIAHRSGLVHGAISPENVFLTDSGEIKLTDFASTTTRLEGPRSAQRWWSPEQARGEEPSRTSDLYSLGLLLREMFGERDREVRRLVASLVQEAPAERTTAAVTLGRLKRLASRRKRRIRMAVVIAAIAIAIVGTIKYAVDLERERAAAIAARAEAEARREQANKLVAFMILDVRPKLSFAGRLDIMDATSEKALEYFASLEAEDLTPAEAGVNLEALQQLAQAQMARGNYVRARRILEHSIRIGDAVLRRVPRDRDLRYAIAGGHGMLSNTLDKLGFSKEALVQARQCVAMMTALAREYPDAIDIIRNEASAHGILGLLYDRSENVAASLAEIELSIAGKRRVLPLNDTPEVRVDLAVPIHKAGLAKLKLGRFEQAQMTLEPERASLEAILARNPSYWPMRELLTIFDDDLVQLNLATGDLDSASRYAESQLARSQQLTRFDPENIDWSRHLAVAHRSRGNVARMRGDLALAIREHQTAVDLFAAIFARGKETNTLVREMAASRIELARSHLAAGQPSSALAQTKLAVEALEPSRGEIPVQRLLADAFLVRGETYSLDQDPAGALAAWMDALQLLEPLDDLSPDPRVADLHARVLLHLGRVNEARPLIQDLSSAGYGNREFAALCTRKGDWSPAMNGRVYGH